MKGVKKLRIFRRTKSKKDIKIVYKSSKKGFSFNKGFKRLKKRR